MTEPGNLRGVSSSGRTLDAAQLAAMRPAKKTARRPRKPRREPLDRSLTFFCSNPQCDHRTWSAQEQAIHMAREFDWAAKALMKLAPDSNEALKLTGGMVLRDLTDEQCRAAQAQSRIYYVDGRDIPGDVRIAANEYRRRLRAGVITPVPRRLDIQGTCGDVPDGEEAYVTRYGRRCCGKCRWCRSRRARWTEEGKEKRREQARRHKQRRIRGAAGYEKTRAANQ